MKILIVHSNFNQKNLLKQPWRFSYELSYCLVKLGHEVCILTDSSFKDSKNIDNLKIQTVPPEYIRSKLGQNKTIMNFDIMLYFGNSLSGIYLSEWKRRRPKLDLYISSIHYSIYELSALSPRELRMLWPHLLFSVPPFSYAVRLLNRSTISAIIVPNNVLKDRLIEYGVKKEKINVLPVHFNLKEFIHSTSNDKDEARKMLELSDEDFIITYFGSPLTIRGTDTLIKAAQLLKRWLKKFKVFLLSRTDSLLEMKENDYLYSLIKKFNLSTNVKLVPGILNQSEIKNYIVASDVIALPFKIVQSEPPLSILECMALGRSIITTRTCGLPSLVSPNRGLLVKPADYKNLARSILFLAENPDVRVKFENNAKEYISNLPPLENIVRLYIKLMEDVNAKND